MKAGDLVRESMSALAGNRSRTALTGLGVLVGTLALSLILSLALGLSNVIDDLVQTDEQLRHVVVSPSFGSRVKQGEIPEIEGEMSDEKRARLVRALAKRSRGGPSMQMRTRTIDEETEKALASLPGVESARPFLQDRFEVTLLAGDPATTRERNFDRDVLSLAVPAVHPYYPDRTIAGRWFTADDERAVVVHELLLFDLGLTSDADQAAAVGRTLRLVARERPRNSGMMEMLLGMPLTARSTESPELYREDVTIVGVLRERFGTEPASFVEEAWSMQTDLFLPLDLARELWNRVPGREGIRGVLLVARDLESVGPLEEAVQDAGLRGQSVRSVVERIKKSLAGATIIAGFLAGIAVFVSGLGIVNTMVMSVLERTREIGLLKALGASDRAVAALFLTEGAVLGVLGGVVGVGLAWLASLGGDEIGRRMISEAMLMPFDGSIFRFPWWLAAGGVLFATVTSLLASVVPAVRAGRIDPVVALRHE